MLLADAVLLADAECARTELPLLCAIRCGASFRMVEMLLRHGAVANHTDSGGLPALSLIASSCPCPSLDMSLDAFFQPCGVFEFGLSPVSEVAGRLSANNMRWLTDEQCLGYAKCLLMHGADMRWKGKDGLTAADRAISSGRGCLVDFLNNWQTCKLLRKLWTRRRQPTNPAEVRAAQSPHSLMDIPLDTFTLMCAYITS